MATPLSASCGQHSLAGLKPENQDALGFYAPDNPLLLDAKGLACALADGISSSELASLASQSAISSFLSDYFSTPDSWSVKQSGAKVLTAINIWLCGQGNQFLNESRAAATTFSAVVIKSTTAHLFHVGDTRIYLWRGGDLELLTQDHRLRLGHDREYLSRALGVGYGLEIDYKSLPVESGDSFVLVTDGVHEHVPDQQLKTLLRQYPDPDRCARHICEVALEQGSDDNISCQVLRIDQLPRPEVEEVYARLTTLPFPPELEQGMVLDGYRIIRELHASSTSQLYLAVDTDSGNKVVLKTPSVNFEDDPAYLERFQLEEWVGRRINSPHVVRTIEQQRPRRFLYYVLEYIEGRTLEQKLDDEGPLSLDEVRRLLPQMIAGLRAFHRLDMLHQDLKPGNILLTDEGLVKIIDFGSARIAGIADIATPIARNTLLGTKQYTAPEYLLGVPGSPQSDQFALGCIVYQMLSGQLPYGEALAAATGKGHLNRLRYTSLRNYQPQLPHWVDRAIARAVSLQPGQRYQALSEFEADIRKPNPAYLQEQQLPLVERHPLAFWRTLSLLLLLGNVLLLALLLPRN
ncbi:bifunctional protein-serine/threonine kinase/phosphatase [Zobellella maritima]|uniref:bifunctional protein-serine/threonine kinase/phosphatase n=1 Tax=Zobellella maritima TaxID=2059725 RepID=UPI000E3093C9|nr:bifunctional protein-serine/threonine kinase/phosphatase [Zobellella maritima]